MEKFFTHMSLAMLFYIILTAPMLSLVLFGVGVQYNSIGILASCLIANIASIIIVNRIYKNKQ